MGKWYFSCLKKKNYLFFPDELPDDFIVFIIFLQYIWLFISKLLLNLYLPVNHYGRNSENNFTFCEQIWKI